MTRPTLTFTLAAGLLAAALAAQPPMPAATQAPAAILVAPAAAAAAAPVPLLLRIPAPYEARDYRNLLGMPGFSGTLLSNHFKLYQGYVNNVNLLLSNLRTLLAGAQETTPPYAEQKRRLGWEFNGMRLHEYYFDNLGGTGVPATNTALYAQLCADFGSYDSWKRDFAGTGTMRGIGWVVLYYDPCGGRLLNLWINEHEANHMAGGVPLLVLDVFEHAYVTDYQLDRAAYLAAFFGNINWEVVAARFSP
jgi:Fe-Mn family superoxide dismutase